MKLIEPITRTRWELLPVSAVHERKRNCSPVAVACHHGIHHDAGHFELAPNRVLAYVPFMVGTSLLSKVDKADSDPAAYKPGQRTVCAYRNDSLFEADSRLVPVFIVATRDEIDCQLDVALFTDLQDAEEHRWAELRY